MNKICGLYTIKKATRKPEDIEIVEIDADFINNLVNNGISTIKIFNTTFNLFTRHGGDRLGAFSGARCYYLYHDNSGTRLFVDDIFMRINGELLKMPYLEFKDKFNINNTKGL